MTTKKETKQQKEKPAMSRSFKEVYDRIQSSAAGILFIDTPEEDRILREIYSKFHEYGNISFASFTLGLVTIDKKQDPKSFKPFIMSASNAKKDKKGVSSENNPMAVLNIIEEETREKMNDATLTDKNRDVYVLRDFDRLLKQPNAIRKLRDIVYLTNSLNVTIVITGYGISIPPELEKDSSYVKLEYPKYEEIYNYLAQTNRNIVASLKKDLDKSDPIAVAELEALEKTDIQACSIAACGLTLEQITNVVSYSFQVTKQIKPEIITEEKRNIINKTDILEYWSCDEDISSIGGFTELKEWLDINKHAMLSSDSDAFKAKPPKAIMILGMQGSGKTQIAKASAKTLKMGLIKFDISKCFAGLVGESEKRMRNALSLIDAAGGVVVIDELEKGLSGAGSSDRTDGGTTSRVIGSLLTWMQEDHPGVFIIATANNISNLNRNHPELLRKGRIAEIWFSDIPTKEERKEIIRIHLKKRNRNPDRFDLDKIANISYSESKSSTRYDYTGAEIEHAIEDSIRKKFAAFKADKKNENIKPVIDAEYDINTEDIIESLEMVKPLSFISKDTIREMRDWSKVNARNVSKEVVESQKSVIRTKNLRADISSMQVDL